MISLRPAAQLLAFPMLVDAWPVHGKDTNHIFVSSEKDHAVYVLDGESHEVVKTIRTAARTRHIQFNPERTLIYAECGDGDAIDVAKLELVDGIGPIDD